ncbi:MAG: sigma-54-dependent Fis family transcriptional regulator [Deltaproteobacteria bacterium]|nr:sigma-54-dependent Fis family transcriptional regulator [Deltaproteobacteria bacterium]MCZ6451521.1 sigma-54 dependent transcriptional regulator [Deltaproteobacteria bacterium]MCZ6548153.1 sigma-54 dependent transcriptional regulator [Deltaproteobacteria bacterium]MCZ6621368.1 sigma-54 dependent transcriptional regulator [Deltaproteobacteria bacterium]MCZ6906208.1 sigma-54 dependent transcriptional regulator [Deltaproteobacteria bacterium]
MEDSFSILVVDDEPPQLELISGFLKKQGFEVTLAESGEKALQIFRRESFDLVLTDQRMPNLSGLDLLKAVRAVNPETPVIVVTAYGSIETAVSAIKAGATDYLTKPLNLDELLHRIEKVREHHRLVLENRDLREELGERHRIEGIIGESGRMLEVFSLVRRVAPSEATVLIRGESGTGKELIAKAIHFASPRASGPLVKVNCAALPETLLESELFGHEKGAFTGAFVTRKGRFEVASGGTIFLDEIGDLPTHLQAKLLRVLQEREFERVGSSKPISIDVRILAATHRDLERLLKAGQFRDDLYYRLNVVTIVLPPLRERRQDLPLFMDHLLRVFAEKNGKKIRGFTSEAREALLRYDYPGNVRELENIIERASVITRNDVIGRADLPISIQEPEVEVINSETDLPVVVERLERRMIREALARSGGVQTRAAEQLGITERALRYKLKKYGFQGEDTG